MEPTNLQSYIEDKIRAGATKDYIKEQVLAVGWTDDDFDKSYADALMAIGVPTPAITRGNYAKRASVGDIVLNFFSFILLGIAVSAVGVLYYKVIDVFFPDSLDSNGYSSYYYTSISSTIHYAISALVVSFPLYYIAVRMWFKKFKEDEAKIESKITKWLTYLVLLATAVTIVGDLITVIFELLQGEITIRFILKAIVILILAGTVFAFYFLERKKIQNRVDIPKRVFIVFGYVFSVFILLGIVLGFMASGGPNTERARRFDQERSQDLSQISSCIDRYVKGVKRFPSSLVELKTYQGTANCTEIYDPETNVPYEYRITESLTSQAYPQAYGSVQLGEIELCANFTLSTLTDKAPYDTDELGGGFYYGDNSFDQHGAGRTCFERQMTDTEELY
jgi:hypothetical protein